MVVVTATNNPEVEFPDVKLLDLITAGPQLLKRCLHFPSDTVKEAYGQALYLVIR